MIDSSKISKEQGGIMLRKKSIRIEILALCGSIVVVLIGAIPLFDRHNLE